MDLERVLQFLNNCQARDIASVLVTVCAVEGSSMRNPGTIMGVAEDGSFAGSLSGGCIENAVVAEALDALKAGEPRLVRFGAGSPYLDIKLPCGGGLDLHFALLGKSQFLSQCNAAVVDRQPFAIRLDKGVAQFAPRWEDLRFDATSQTGSFGHWPKPRIAIIGHGAGVEALAGLGANMGCAIEAFTPDERILKALKQQNVPATLLNRATQVDVLQSDAWTAFVFLFHDHDWELDLIQRALDMPHFYLGAMGGRKAHAFRCDALRERGVSDAKLETIRAPIGLFHSSRDPQTLALSTLAQVIRAYEESNFDSAAI